MEQKTILAIKDFIENAEKSIKNAKKLLIEVLKDENIDLWNHKFNLDSLTDYRDNDNKIIEWIFTWEDMLWADNNRYPIPANYASKSKLVQWDRLKLTIDTIGRMTYKQILPIPRFIKTWIIAKENDRYIVICDSKSYNLLQRAVTHFKLEIWDKVSVVLPEWKDATFAAIEMALPKDM